MVASDEGSAAERVGLPAGDVIVAVNRRPVTTAAELASALQGVTGTIALELYRDGTRLFLAVL